jgi:BirA family transcriptional regulator, biotin operon repressor / biotin---[acetyl-CoA-carboxylase] ligase
MERTKFGDIRWVSETGSTNADLLALAAEGAPEGIVLVADHQTAGRGRLDRSWTAPPGSSLLVSVLLRPDLDPAHAWLLASAAGLAVVDACVEVNPEIGLTLGLKWPNDVVAVDSEGVVIGKLAGSLAESVVRGDALDAVILGFGINVNWPHPVPPELDGVAVALNGIAGGEVDREGLLIDVLTRLDHWLAELTGGEAGRTRLLDAVRSRSVTIGRHVRVELPDGVIEGEAVDVDDDGELVVQIPGEAGPRVVRVGDVIHLRPTS